MTESNLRVLVIDDDEADRMTVTRHLRESFCVIEASTGAQGEEFVRSYDPACVLLDYRLPDVTGLDLLKQLVSQDIPVLLLTGAGNEAVAAEAIKTGAYDYFSKSDLSETKLTRALYNAVEKSRLREEIETRFNDFEKLVAAAESQFRDSLFEISGLALSAREHLDADNRDASSSDLTALRTSVKGLVEFTRQLIDHAKTAGGEILIERIDLQQLVDEVTSNFCDRHPDIFQFNIAKLPVINGDKALLKRVFNLLFSNALQFRRPGHVVHNSVASRLQRNQWVISVANDCESPEYDDTALFDPRGWIDSKHGEGVGLEFATCAKIIKRHHGRIWLESSGENGMTVSFTLPVIEYQRTM